LLESERVSSDSDSRWVCAQSNNECLMKLLNRVKRQVIVSALGTALMILLSMPLAAQDPSLPIDQDAPFVTTDRPNLDGAFDHSRQRQLSNVPDDIGYQLQESEGRVDAMFSLGLLTPLHNLWERTNGQLKDSIGLDLGLNYTAVYQRADTTVRGPRDASDGDLDFFGRWHLLGCEDHWPGSLVFSSETRHKYSAISPNSLDTGTAGGTIVGFGTQDFSLVQMYWEEGSYEDRLITRLGKMDSALIYDGGRYVSSNYAFLSPAFSDTLPMALPGAGLGVAGAVYPTESTYIAAGVHDANGQRTTAGFNTFFGEGEYFSAVELGWFPNEHKTNEGMYHITFWNIDSRQNAGRPNDRGMALTLEQQFGCDGNLVPFLRYAYAHRGLNGIRQNLSLGVGIEDVFGQNDDVVGLATSWEDPSNPMLRDQYIVEAFYRFYITPFTHLTPDIQVVLDPANSPTKDSVTIFGLRLRTLY
jgi:porin